MTSGVRVVGGRLAAVLDGHRPAGVYRWLSRAHPESIRREAAAAGWATHLIDGWGLTGAQPVFDRCARVMSFPLRFAHTWEGLTDCLRDLTWLPALGHLVLWDRVEMLAQADARAWRAAYQAFDQAIAERRRADAPPLYLLLRGGPSHRPDGPGVLPAL
ncbi:MAG TPA: barstar family protein [Pilimelia sp.]|nr:barstar family protein [Pilimelia sp.]